MEQLKAREKKMEAMEKRLNARVTEFVAAKKKYTTNKASWEKKARATEIEIEAKKEELVGQEKEGDKREAYLKRKHKALIEEKRKETGRSK